MLVKDSVSPVFQYLLSLVGNGVKVLSLRNFVWVSSICNIMNKVTLRDKVSHTYFLFLLLLAGVSVFGAFLRSEFSEENLQFYLACEQYRQSSNNFSLQRRAKDICATYIQPGAPREVQACFYIQPSFSWGMKQEV